VHAVSYMLSHLARLNAVELLNKWIPTITLLRGVLDAMCPVHIANNACEAGLFVL